jgi:predicted alpha/beta-fold hydrolase
LLNLCASKLDNGFSKLYRGNLLDELKTYMRLKQAHLEENGHHAEAEKIRQLGDCSKISSFWQYDDVVVAGLHGFKDVHDYYQRASSRQFLKHITVPTLVIQADDDPFMTPAVLPTQHELSAHVQLEITRGGGHVGFVAQQGLFRPRYWLEQRIPAFLAPFLGA